MNIKYQTFYPINMIGTRNARLNCYGSGPRARPPPSKCLNNPQFVYC